MCAMSERDCYKSPYMSAGLPAETFVKFIIIIFYVSRKKFICIE